MTIGQFATEYDLIKNHDDFNKLHKRLEDNYNNGKIDNTYNYVTMRLALFFREYRTFDALQLIRKHKSELRDSYYVLRAKLYIKENKYQDGLSFIQKCLDSGNLSSADSLFKLKCDEMQCLYYLGDYKKVIELYNKENKTVEGDGKNEVMFHLFLSYFYYLSCILQNNEKEDAIKEIKSLVSNNKINEKFIYHDYLFIDSYDFDKKRFCSEKLNECFKALNKYELFYYIIRYSFSLEYTPDSVTEDFVNSDFIEREDAYFALLTENVIDQNLKNKYKKIWFWIQMILVMLMVKDEDHINRFCYYTSQDVGLKLLMGLYSMQKSSLSNVNDTLEGDVLPVVLQRNGLNSDIDCINKNNYIAIQTSYTRREESLTMFRLYGKKNNKEGTGLSFVFNKTFFKTDLSHFVSNEGFFEENIFFKDIREPLIWILYYDKNQNKFYYYPSDNEHNMYAVDLNQHIFAWNCGSDNKKQTENRLGYLFQRLFDEINSIENKEDKLLAVQLLYKLRYCIKSDDFMDEKECRMLELCNPSSDDVYKRENDVLYKEYLNINNGENYLSKIIIGNKVDDSKKVKECIQRLLQNKLVEVQIMDTSLR